MTKFVTLIFAIPLISTSFAAKDPIIASVNGINISKSVLDKTYNQNLLFVSDKRVTKEKVLDDLINRALGIQRAKRNKLQEDPIVKEKMEDIMYHAQVSKDLEPKLKKIVVTDKDVRDYYRDHNEYRTAQILLRVRANPEEKEWQEALKQAKSIYAAVTKNPDKFAEYANKFSQSSTAPSGGDMGFQPVARLAPEYWDAIKDKPKGYISPPARTQFGYHIIKVLAVKDFKSINTTLYKKIVYDIKRDKILADYFAELRKNAKIKILENVAP